MGRSDSGPGTLTLQRPPGREEPPPEPAAGGATVAPPPPKAARPGPAFSLRHWKVRSKLAAVLLVPALAFLVLASINMAGQIGSARDYGRGANVAEFGRQASSVVYELQAERDIAAGFIAAGRPDSNQPAITKAIAQNAKIAAENEKLPLEQQKLTVDVPEPNTKIQLSAQQANLNTALKAYQSAQAKLGDVGPQAKARIEAARSQLDGLSSVRAALDHRLLTEGAITGRYTGMIDSLLAINQEIGQGTANSQLSGDVAGLTALSDLKETLSRERALLFSVASTQGGARFQFAQQQDFASVIAERGAALQRFRADATDAQIGLYDTAVPGQAVLAVKRLEDGVAREPSGATLQLDAQQWWQAATTYVSAMRGVESAALDQTVQTTRDLRSDAQRQAITTGVIIAAILVIAFLTSLLIARSMIGPLRRLQAGARDVAEVRLPEAIARLQRPDATAAPPEVEPIGIDSRDEIGQVARTFDQLHTEAVRLASEQAGLRRNVNDMFVNLSRRSQGLVERQLKLIDELETGEQDPDQLANLFKLDHLATRMRRNSENLLVLAGEDAGRRWGRPIPLVDVLRAATSEVEQYHRIQLTGVPDVEVMGHAVNHLVHLVAELLENATVFSSPESKVLVHSQRLSDGGAMVEIEDRGIGMSAHEIADSNEKLAKPPEFDVSVSRMMGLYVVGRLATRHGITVRLRQSETGGVSAFVRVPVDVLANRFAQQQRPDDTAGGPPPMAADGRGAAALPAADGRSGLPVGPGAFGGPGGPGGSGIGPIGPGPRQLGPGPAADLPRRSLARPAGGPPEQPPTPGSPPLPRRTPATASGSDGASAGGTDDLPVNGMAGNGIPGGRPMPPVDGPNGPGGNGRGPVPDERPGPDERPRADGRFGPDGRPVPEGFGPDAARLGPDGRPVPEGFGPDAARLGPDGRPGFGPPAGQRGALPPRPMPGPLGGSPLGAPPYGQDERTPIFEQLQSEWFRQRPAARPADGGAPAPAAVPERPATPAGAPAAQDAAPAAAAPEVEAPAQAPDEAWASPADEGWRAAERLLQPTSGGTTRAGLPMRVPQAHLMPGGADGPTAAPPEPQRPAYRSPEAVRSRLASYHQGVRRGRHADRPADGATSGDNGERDPSEVLVQQSQEQS